MIAVTQVKKEKRIIKNIFKSWVVLEEVPQYRFLVFLALGGVRKILFFKFSWQQFKYLVDFSKGERIGFFLYVGT